MEILRRKVNWIGHILKINCLLRDVIEGQMAEAKGVGKRKTQLLDDLRYRRCCELKMEQFGNHSFSHDHKEEIKVIFHKFMHLLTCSILNNNFP